MKITEVRRVNDPNNKYADVFAVTFQPSWLEEFFGKKPETKEYKDTGYEYTFGGGHVYIDRLGNQLGNGNSIGEAIDAFRRRW